MLRAFSSPFLDPIRGTFGDPAHLRRALKEHPQMRASLDPPSQSICLGSIPAWEQLGSINQVHVLSQPKGKLHGWRRTGDHWLGFYTERSEYTQIVRCEQASVTVDLEDVHGFSNSKSDLTAFRTTDDLVVARRPKLIREISERQLNKLLSHREIRVIHSPGADSFARYQWDAHGPRLWMLNQGGSHHLSAAKFVASRLGERVLLTGTLRTWSFDAGAVASLRADFEMFAVAQEGMRATVFGREMERFRATWLWHPLPRPYEHCIGVLLPRSEVRSVRAAEELRNAGFADLGEHLSLLSRS